MELLGEGVGIGFILLNLINLSPFFLDQKRFLQFLLLEDALWQGLLLEGVSGFFSPLILIGLLSFSLLCPGFKAGL